MGAVTSNPESVFEGHLVKADIVLLVDHFVILEKILRRPTINASWRGVNGYFFIHRPTIISKADKRSKVVVRRQLVGLLPAALLTGVDNGEAAAASDITDRRHQAAAGGRSIAGVLIHMFAPKTARAVIGITVANHALAAMLATKIFRLFDKSL